MIEKSKSAQFFLGVNLFKTHTRAAIAAALFLFLSCQTNDRNFERVPANSSEAAASLSNNPIEVKRAGRVETLPNNDYFNARLNELLEASNRMSSAQVPAPPQPPNPTASAAPPETINNVDIWSDVPEVKEYGESAPVAGAINAGKMNAKAKSARYCYRAAKYHMCKPSRQVSNFASAASISGANCEAGSLVKRSPSGRAAFEAKGELKKAPNNMVDLLETPCKGRIKGVKDAPKGAVIIYDSIPLGSGDRGCERAKPNNLKVEKGRTRYGHIEIKSEWGNKGAYYSDFAAKDSILKDQNKMCGLRWKVSGVMINLPAGTNPARLCQGSAPK